MPVLPKLSLVVFRRLTIAILSIFFFALSALNHSVSAQPGPPNPQPCKNPVVDEFSLVDHYLTDEDGNPPIEFTGDEAITVTGFPGEQVALPPRTFTFSVDFSKLQSLFANPSSNYLEGKFQNNEHRFLNIFDLNSQDFNSYHGAVQKVSPKTLTDEQKVNYVEYVYNKPTLAESENRYTDIEGAGDPKTVYDLVTEFGLPEPPVPGEDRTAWNDSWGRYWGKIPTAYTEFYEGEIAFHYLVGQNSLEQLEQNGQCPPRIEPPIRIVLPEFYRTTAVSDQLNRQVVAKEAQSYQDHGILTAKAPSNPLAKAAVFCWELIKNSAGGLKDIVKISFDFINPIKTASAQEPENESCIKRIENGKEGGAPYCPLPLEEANQPGVSCTNKNDPNKLEPDNPNVVCTFTRTLSNATITIDPQNPAFDSCTQNANGSYTCTLTLQILPNFRIPWLAAIWNNTLYSDEEPSLINQDTGRPGIFGAFTPEAAKPLNTDMTSQEILDFCATGNNNESDLCQRLGAEFSACLNQGGIFGDCLLSTLKLAANTPDAGAQDPKERFIGAVDECGKELTRDNSLLPKAVQEFLNIEKAC